MRFIDLGNILENLVEKKINLLNNLSNKIDNYSKNYNLPTGIYKTNNFNPDLFGVFCLAKQK